MDKELAEQGRRPGISEDDARKYTGIAKHPRARRWLHRRLNAEMRKAIDASGQKRERHRERVESLREEMADMGMEVR